MDLLDELKRFSRLRGDTFSSAEVIGLIGAAVIECERLRAALKPFAYLAGKLDGAPNLIGLLTEADFKRAAEAFGDEQKADDK